MTSSLRSGWLWIAAAALRYVLRRQYGPARYVITAASWITVFSLLLQPVAAGAISVSPLGSAFNVSTWNPTDFTVGPNGMLVVVLTGESAANVAPLTISSMTYGGTAMTLVDKASAKGSDNSHAQTWIYYLPSPANGTGDISFTSVGSWSRYALTGVYATGVDQGAPESKGTKAQAGVFTLTTDPISVSNGSLVIDVAANCANNTNPSFTTGSGLGTQFYNYASTVNTAMGASYRIASSAGSVTTTWDDGALDGGSGRAESIVIASFKAIVIPSGTLLKVAEAKWRSGDIRPRLDR